MGKAKCILCKLSASQTYRAVVYTEFGNTTGRAVIDFKENDTLEDVKAYLSNTFFVNESQIEMV